MKKALILIACAATGFASAQTIVNGDFSADHYSTGGWNEISSLTGWSIIGNDMAGIGKGYLGAPNQEIDLSGGSDHGGTGISQMLNTVSGQTYNLSFDVYTGGGYGYAGGVDVSVGGTQLGTNLQGLFGSDASLDRKNYSYSFTATSDHTNLTLMDNNGFVSHVGNVKCQAVPEPASFLALGAPALLMFRRRNKK